MKKTAADDVERKDEATRKKEQGLRQLRAQRKQAQRKRAHHQDAAEPLLLHTSSNNQSTYGELPDLKRRLARAITPEP